MSFWHDLRHGARLFRHAPLFTLGSIFVLALGIGSTTAMFSLVDAALIRPLPFPDSKQLVMLWERVPQNAHNRVAGAIAGVMIFVAVVLNMAMFPHPSWFKGTSFAIFLVAVTLGPRLGAPPRTVAAE